MNLSPEPNLEDKPAIRLAIDDGAGGPGRAKSRAIGGGVPASGGVSQHGSPGAGDFLALLEAVLRRWPWLLLSGALCTLAGFAEGLRRWETVYSARAQLVLYDASHVLDVFRPKPFLLSSLPKLIQSPEVLRRVSESLQPSISPDALGASLRVVPERNGEFVTVAVTGATPVQAVDRVNAYAKQAILFAKKLMAEEAAEIRNFVDAQVTQVEQNLSSLNQKWESAVVSSPKASAGKGATVLAAKLSAKLDAAYEKLAELLKDWKDEYPLVVRQRAEIKALQEQIDALKSQDANLSLDSGIEELGQTGPPIPTNQFASRGSESRPEFELMRSQIQAQQHELMALRNRKDAAAYFAENPVGYYRLYAPARLDDVMTHGRKLKVVLLGLFAGVLGVGAVAAFVLFVEVADDRLKTPEDLRRVTGLPILATVGDVSRPDDSGTARVAFRVWLSLKKRLTSSPNRGGICGLISSNGGTECSTWLQLLAQAANECGYRVLTIATGHSEEKPQPNGVTSERKPGINPSAVAVVSRGSDLLASTTEISEKLEDPDSPSIVQLLVPEWAWNVKEHLKWQAAFDLWSQIDSLVIFVEMPPASSHPAVLLAQRLPNLVWLAESGQAKAADTQQHVETLRQAGCNVIGAVLNNERPSLMRNFLPRWRSLSR